MTVANFIKKLQKHPEYCIEDINVSADEIEIIVSEYNEAQLEIPESAYGRNVVVRIFN